MPRSYTSGASARRGLAANCAAPTAISLRRPCVARSIARAIERRRDDGRQRIRRAAGRVGRATVDRGVDAGGQDDAHPDAALSEHLLAQRPREPQKAVLGRDVGCDVGARDLREERPHENDRARPATAEMREHRVGIAHRSEEVRLDHAVAHGIRGLFDRSVGEHGCRRHPDVDPAEAQDGGVHGAPRGAGQRQVQRERQDLGAEPAAVRRGRVEGHAIPADEREPSAASGEADGGGPADAS